MIRLRSLFPDQPDQRENLAQEQTLGVEVISGCKPGFLGSRPHRLNVDFRSDWTLDLTHPRVDANEGWQYARSFDDPDEQWSAEPPPLLERILSGAGVLSRPGPSTSGPSYPINIGSSSQSAQSDATSWVRRRRWIRVLRRRLDIPPLPFLQPDGMRYHLGTDGTLVPVEENQVGSYEGEGQEMGTFISSVGGQDYVSRARYLAGTQRKGSVSVGLIDNNGFGINGETVSAADLKRAIGRLERASVELRAGILSAYNVFSLYNFLPSKR